MAEPTLWGIHAGRTGDANSLFLGQGMIAIGWHTVGDLNQFPDRDSMKARVASVFPEKKPGAIPNWAGQLFRFAQEIAEGDIVCYPSKIDKRIHIGRVTGPYVYSASPEPSYPHHHSVTWEKEVPRTSFSQGALYEIGSALSLFQIKTYADEFVAALEGGALSVADDDESLSLLTEGIEQTTADFIIKTLARELKGHPFADFVAHLLQSMGYRTRVSPEGPDGGIDIIAHRDELGFEPPIVKVQVKSSEGNIGDPEVSALYGKVDGEEYGLLVALGGFTAPAKQFARNKSNLRLVGGEELVQLILSHYDGFDARYKGLLPLKRVYVPEAIKGDSP